ncbi:uncharacterized protein BYT42DRAFT_505494 [Radiomyces spectabilis]|uniref:uncharacterized protein n=1 Tax=Radiomyces spectabilis TaxID=64574 RepID=UPI00222026CC|nr:uncharacterized protein BYT42DRAFT_505494 [Radiomyces spectabilis]KAI8365935.1 hypothetical protein BYT42DRAFT_505494 [Radiomyces spectabilis]
MAPKGHFLAQIPQPIQSSSEMKAILAVGSTSIQNLPRITSSYIIKKKTYHSCLHFLGLHLSAFTMAIRVSASLMVYKKKQMAKWRRGGRISRRAMK